MQRPFAADPLRRFYNSTSPVGREAIDKSNGRALLLNGEMFYSPNCSRTVTLPPNRLSITPASSDITSLCQPLWWTLETVHLAFMPLDHTFFGDFQEIFETRGLDYNTKFGFSLDPGKILSWNRVQFELKHAVAILLRRAYVPPFPDLINSALVCGGSHRSAESLRSLIDKTRKWFFYWFCKFSYAIAVNISFDREPIAMAFDSLADVPGWFRLLANWDWPQWYLSAIMNTTAVFDPSVPRAGVFLDISPSHPPHQFSVDWFIAFGVPVWYRWNSNCGFSIDERLIPLSHQLQDAATFLHQTLVQHDQPWIPFLEDRLLRCERMKDRETERQREVRLAREREPPTAGALVFEWEMGLDGSYRRVSVPARMRAELLEDYGRCQKVYNSVLNEWDCVREMGEKQLDELEAERHEDEDMEPILPFAPFTEFDMSNDAYLLSLDRRPPTSGPTWELVSDVHQFEATSILHEYCGFVPPLPNEIDSTPLEVDSNERLKYTKLIGMVRMDHAYFSSPVANHAISFLNSLIHNQNPGNDVWDLAPENRMTITGCKRISHLKRIAQFYVFDFGHLATVPWMLAVERADVALLVCRLDEDYNDYELSHALLQRGVGIRTFTPLPKMQPRHPPLTPLPIRLPGYTFSASDLIAYEDQLAQLLRNPRISRAAIMSGGIVWRLAITVGFTAVLMGPTAVVRTEKIGESFPIVGNPLALWDDICTERELDLICGANVCFNGGSIFYI